MPPPLTPGERVVVTGVLREEISMLTAKAHGRTSRWVITPIGIAAGIFLTVFSAVFRTPTTPGWFGPAMMAVGIAATGSYTAMLGYHIGRALLLRDQIAEKEKILERLEAEPRTIDVGVSVGPQGGSASVAFAF